MRRLRATDTRHTQPPNNEKVVSSRETIYDSQDDPANATGIVARCLAMCTLYVIEMGNY